MDIVKLENAIVKKDMEVLYVKIVYAKMNVKDMEDVFKAFVIVNLDIKEKIAV